MTLATPTTWADHWRDLVAGRDSQRGTDQRDGDPTRDPWAQSRRSFRHVQQGTARTMIRSSCACALPCGPRTPSSMSVRVRVAMPLPLATLAREVIAVEPSPAMRRHLAERLTAENARNITVVGAAWPADDVAPADVTICSHVVYGVREIAPFLRALDGHTRRLCLISIRVDQHPGITELSRALFGEERVRQPALLDLYGALLELGIAADVHIIPASGGFRFANPDEAIAHFRDRLRIPPDSPTEAHLRTLLAADLIQEPDGRWRWPTPRRATRSSVGPSKGTPRPPITYPRIEDSRTPYPDLVGIWSMAPRPSTSSLGPRVAETKADESVRLQGGKGMFQPSHRHQAKGKGWRRNAPSGIMVVLRQP